MYRKRQKKRVIVVVVLMNDTELRYLNFIQII